MKPREYEFPSNLPNDIPCLVVVNIWGYDFPGNHVEPPEWREVEVSVFVVDPINRMTHPFMDITDTLSSEYLDVLRDQALDIDDAHIYGTQNRGDDEKPF